MIRSPADDGNFYHDCCGTYESEFGSPVFNTNGQLVGINFVYHNGYTTAVTIRYIAMSIDKEKKRIFKVTF